MPSKYPVLMELFYTELAPILTFGFQAFINQLSGLEAGKHCPHL